MNCESEDCTSPSRAAPTIRWCQSGGSKSVVSVSHLDGVSALKYSKEILITELKSLLRPPLYVGRLGTSCKSFDDLRSGGHFSKNTSFHTNHCQCCFVQAEVSRRRGITHRNAT